MEVASSHKIVTDFKQVKGKNMLNKSITITPLVLLVHALTVPLVYGSLGSMGAGGTSPAELLLATMLVRRVTSRALRGTHDERRKKAKATLLIDCKSTSLDTFFRIQVLLI